MRVRNGGGEWLNPSHAVLWLIKNMRFVITGSSRASLWRQFTPMPPTTIMPPSPPPPPFQLRRPDLDIIHLRKKRALGADFTALLCSPAAEEKKKKNWKAVFCALPLAQGLLRLLAGVSYHLVKVKTKSRVWLYTACLFWLANTAARLCTRCSRGGCGANLLVLRG